MTRVQRGAGRFRVAAAVGATLFITVFAGCRSTPDVDHSFTRTSRLVETIERYIEDEEFERVIHLAQYGYHNDLLTIEESRTYAQRYVDEQWRLYRRSYREKRYRDAVRWISNLHTLERYQSMTGIPVDASSTPSRDTVLLEWSTALIRDDEPVLALAILLRRSQIADLSEEQIREYIEIARQLNHDEAFHRLSRVAERKGVAIPPADEDVAAPGDEPARMLAGTVTVWVNRGIRIEEGLGFPDRAIGSGFFVDPRGYLITNYHVISSEVDPTYEGYSRLFVKLPGRPDERVPARVVGYDRIFDLALLKVEIDPTYVFSLSDTQELAPGQPVLAFGSPGGLDSTITSGIISASGRRFLQMGEAMQVDVPINPGNSGGPLVLPSGQVAGVVFAGLEQFEGVNFAIPSYWIRHFFPRLFEEGEVVHPWMGISVRAVDTGLEVVYVAPDSPAELVGVRAGDVLTHIDGMSGLDLGDAQDLILAGDNGRLIHTVWQRKNEAGSIDTVERLIALGARPFSPVEDALEQQPIESLFPVLFGMEVDDLSGAPWGPDFVITEVFPGSVADESSLSVDDPFALRNWRVDRDLRAAFIQIIIKKKKAGFIESGIQLGAYLETDSFL